MWSLKLKFQTVAEKTAKNFRGLLYFAAPGTSAIYAVIHSTKPWNGYAHPRCTKCPKLCSQTSHEPQRTFNNGQSYLHQACPILLVWLQLVLLSGGSNPQNALCGGGLRPVSNTKLLGTCVYHWCFQNGLLRAKENSNSITDNIFQKTEPSSHRAHEHQHIPSPTYTETRPANRSISNVCRSI